MIIFIFLILLIIIKKFRFTVIKNRLSYIKEISYNEFLELKFTKNKQRFEHLNLLTDSLKYTKVKDIIEYIKNNQKKFIIKERKINNKIDVGNSHLNSYYFWKEGNSLLYYNVVYEFRKNVIEYQNLNFYVNQIPNLYSENYYKNLEPMNNLEIKKFLFNNHIILYKKDITIIKHGFHRIFAMIGRLIKNKVYIPFYAAIL
jgi:hypothetical protein